MIAAIFANLIRILLFPFHAMRRRRACPPGGYVALELDGRVRDLPAARSRLVGLLRPRARGTSVGEVRELGKRLSADPRAAGLLVRIDQLRAGPAVLASLREALLEIRAMGKDVVVHLPMGADNRALFLASAARLIVVGPETSVAPLGYAVHGRYLRRAFARLGLEPEVFARGAYKSVGEALVREEMSEPQREQVGALLEAQHEALVSALAQGRRVEREVAGRWIDEAPYGAREALELGLIDAVAYDDELDRAVLGPDAGGRRLLTVEASRYLRARAPFKLRPVRPEPSIGIVEVHGPIVSRADFSLGPLAVEERVVAALRSARANRKLEGVVLHIDSPGGSALASDRIYHEVLRLSEAKPVIAYLSNVAASGGYYVAAAAHMIIAQPQAVTGSIGVVSARLAVGPLLERLGIDTDTVKRGARSDLYSTSRRLDEGERQVVERDIESFYKTFLGVVARGRGRSVEEIQPLAEGRVYSGGDAHARGLVDQLGGFERALHEMRSLLGPEAREMPARLVPPPRALPPPPALLPAPLAALVRSLGLGRLTGLAQLGLHVHEERALAYWSGGEADADCDPESSQAAP